MFRYDLHLKSLLIETTSAQVSICKFCDTYLIFCSDTAQIIALNLLFFLSWSSHVGIIPLGTFHVVLGAAF